MARNEEREAPRIGRWTVGSRLAGRIENAKPVSNGSKLARGTRSGKDKPKPQARNLPGPPGTRPVPRENALYNLWQGWPLEG